MSKKKYTVTFSIDVSKFDRKKVLEDAKEQGCCTDQITDEDDIIFINEKEKEEFNKMIYALQCLGYSTRKRD